MFLTCAESQAGTGVVSGAQAIFSAAVSRFAGHRVGRGGDLPCELAVALVVVLLDLLTARSVRYRRNERHAEHGQRG
jgi:hypothetical protein